MDNLTFPIIQNDNTDQNLIKLVKIKNIFRKQLPKMPGQYIVRLVMDRRHKCMLIMKQNSIIGGVCFRNFQGKNFSQIAFLAVTYSQQVRGYGTILMNNLKNYVMQDGIRYFLTYADNFALGYFRKQGFSSQVESILPEINWRGYIKDYDGGTLMVCKLEPSVDYTIINSQINRQYEFIKKLVESISLHQVVRQPNSVLLAEGRCSYQDIDGLQQVHYHPDNEVSSHQEEKDAKQACFHFIVDQMISNTSSWPFRDPVGVEVAPDYYDIIKDPIDLNTMKERISQGCYESIEKFTRDVERMFENCRTYNKRDTVYFKMADKLQKFIKPFIDQLRGSSLNS